MYVCMCVACIDYEIWIFKSHGFPIHFVLWRVYILSPQHKMFGKTMIFKASTHDVDMQLISKILKDYCRLQTKC